MNGLTEVNMSSRIPKPNDDAALRLPEPPAADYCDELTPEQLKKLRSVWTQDEAALGPLVHEFRW